MVEDESKRVRMEYAYDPDFDSSLTFDLQNSPGSYWKSLQKKLSDK